MKTKLSPAALTCLTHRASSLCITYAEKWLIEDAITKLMPFVTWDDSDDVPSWQNPFTAGYGANIPAYLAYLRQELQV